MSIIALAGALFPVSANAGVLGDILFGIRGENKAEAVANDNAGDTDTNLQTLPLLEPAMNINPIAGKGGGDVTIVDSSALVPGEGPSGTLADMERTKNTAISLYVVREGDTLSAIAKMFRVSVNTIVWANNMSRGSTLKVGQTLTILPVTGVPYTVKKGDTIASIAKRFDGDPIEIANYNELGGVLVSGTEIIIPNGEMPAPATPVYAVNSPSSGGSRVSAGYYLRPIFGGVRTQGIHGYNGVDLAAPAGTPIVASAPGEIIVSREGGWNGGYGNYVAIRHDNGTQTLYSHNLRNVVGIGERVVQGQVIAYVGATGRATGPHVHFEIRGGPRNPF